MNGLKLEPGWRSAWVTWLYWVRLKSKPPTSARTAPSRGSIETSEASTAGSCVICQRSFSSFCTRMIAPRRMRWLGLALSPSMRAANLRPSSPISTQLPALAVGLDELGARLDHDRGIEVVAVERVLQRVFERLLGELGGQIGIALGAAIAVAPVVVLHAAAHRLVGRFLMRREQRRVDAQALGVGIVLVALVERLAHHLGEMFGVHGELAHLPLHVHDLLLRRRVLLAR